jgi:hypothetical protein
MKRFFAVLVMVVPMLVGCGVGDPTAATDEEAVKVCTLLPIYCPPECKQVGGGCPVQCHCPNYVACGPSLKCHGNEVCCTAGPINIDPSLNHYSCNPAGSLCPL